jgi:hypothetical protein
MIQAISRVSCTDSAATLDGRESLLWIAYGAVHGSTPFPLRPDDWDRLPHDAEANHLSPLLETLLGSHDQAVPEPIGRQLRVLRLRHLAWHRARTAALLEILDTFERLAIDTVVLKGAALAWMIYPSPALRPMSDMDLLVPRAAAGAALEALRRLGFHADRAFRRFGRNAHHLPIASRVDAGLTINVEVHADALSRDTLSSIAFGTLTDPPQPFLLDGARRFTLGRIDMLRHLTHHLLEPTPDGAVRLIGVVDLLRYAKTFHDHIDWERVDRRFAMVTNTLRCLHGYVTLPSELMRLAPDPQSRRPAGVGQIMRPLRSIVAGGRPLASIFRELFDPPEWWMHAYYDVPPGQSLAHVRLVRHPWRVACWLGLRIVGV